MKNWKAIWIMIVSLLHCYFAISSFPEELSTIAKSGFYNAISNTEESLAVWFLLFGAQLFIIGLALFHLKAAELKTPKSLIAALFLITSIGALLMPASGFWLLFVPLLAMLFEKHTPKNTQ